MTKYKELARSPCNGNHFSSILWTLLLIDHITPACAFMCMVMAKFYSHFEDSHVSFDP